jgi:hypothetical protein
VGRAAGPSGQGTVKTVIDWLVIVLFLFLMVRTFLRRKDPRGRLQHGLSGQLDLGARGRLPKRPRRGGVERLRRVVRFARLTHRQVECRPKCRTPASSHPGT